MKTILKYWEALGALIISIVLFFFANKIFSNEWGILLYNIPPLEKILSIILYICSGITFLVALLIFFHLFRDRNLFKPPKHYVPFEQKKEMDGNIYLASVKEALGYTALAIVIFIFFYFMGVLQSLVQVFIGCSLMFVLSFLAKLISICYLRNQNK